MGMSRSSTTPGLVATTQGEATPLVVSESLSEVGTSQSVLAELTALEWENEVPESNMDKAATLCLTSHVPLEWVDGILPTATALSGPETNIKRVRSW